MALPTLDDALVEGLDDAGGVGREEEQLDVGDVVHVLGMGSAVVQDEGDFSLLGLERRIPGLKPP